MQQLAEGESLQRPYLQVHCPAYHIFIIILLDPVLNQVIVIVMQQLNKNHFHNVRVKPGNENTIFFTESGSDWGVWGEIQS